MSEEIQSPSEETLSVGGSLEYRRWVDQQMKENHEALAANGFKPFQQEEGKWKVKREDVEEALRRSRESSIQFDPVDYDEIW